MKELTSVAEGRGRGLGGLGWRPGEDVREGRREWKLISFWCHVDAWWLKVGGERWWWWWWWGYMPEGGECALVVVPGGAEVGTSAVGRVQTPSRLGGGGGGGGSTKGRGNTHVYTHTHTRTHTHTQTWHTRAMGQMWWGKWAEICVK